jgi:hypothetical protein
MDVSAVGVCDGAFDRASTRRIAAIQGDATVDGNPVTLDGWTAQTSGRWIREMRPPGVNSASWTGTRTTRSRRSTVDIHDDLGAITRDPATFVARKVAPGASYTIGPEGHLIVQAYVPADEGHPASVLLPAGRAVTVRTGMALEAPDDAEDRYITVERPYGTWVAVGVIFVGSYVGRANGERLVVLYNTSSVEVSVRHGEPLFVVDFACRVAVTVQEDPMRGSPGDADC